MSLTDDSLADFADSMPAVYHEGHDRAAVNEHARVWAERGPRSANVGVFPSDDGRQATVCMVADDRPGVLACMSAALVSERLDVIDAEAHTRRTSMERPEAVDIFWVRRLDGDERPLTASDADTLRETLCALIEGRIDARDIGGVSPLRRGGETVVRFVEGADKSLTLEVETDDQSGLLLVLSRALFEASVQIAESEVRTLGGRVYDRFLICEFNGNPISPSRRLEIQVAVLSAIQPR
jgi:UTP:GlnB (protein PII) uridylyltransferase